MIKFYNQLKEGLKYLQNGFKIIGQSLSRISFYSAEIPEYNAKQIAQENIKAIASDWNNVGKDLEAAIKQFEKETK